MPALAYVNGTVLPLRRARVSILDRGFLFADGVYEVLRTYDGKPFALQAHLRRLHGSLVGVRLHLPVPQAELARIIDRLLRRSGYRDARVYIQVTRGGAPRQHTFPDPVRPTLVVWVERMTPMPSVLRQRGVSAITLPDPRWHGCDLKTIALLPNVLAKQRAHDVGAHEAIFLGPDGTVREGASANVFIVRGKVLHTHPVGKAILPGVSRQVVLELAGRAGLTVRERPFQRKALYAADEVFLSSTVQEVMPVVRVDGRRIGDGRPGPVAAELWRRFHARAVQPRGGTRPRGGAVGRRRVR